MWRSLTIKTLLFYLAIALAIFCVGRMAGWLSSRRIVVDKQQALLRRLDELGAHYYYDFQLVSDGEKETLEDADSPNVRRHWLSSLFGQDWFHDVFYVSFAQFDSFQLDGGVAAARGEVTDNELVQLSQLDAIRWVALNGAAISDEGILALARLPNLQKLWLSQTAITDHALKSLQACRSLEHLAIEATSTSDLGLAFVVKLPRLEVLSLGSPHLTAGGLRLLKSASSLKELYLDQLPVDDAVLESLGDHLELQCLSLRGTNIGNRGLDALGALKHLRILRLEGTRTDDSTLAIASNWPSLEELGLSGTLVSDAGLLQLRDCSALRILRIDHTRCSLDGVLELLVTGQKRPLADALSVAFETRQDKLGELISLDLKSIRITDADIPKLATLNALQWLELPNNRLTDEGAARIAALEMPALSLLRIDNALISDVGFRELIQIASLRSLHIAATSISDEAIAEARQAKPALRVYTQALGPPAKP